MNIAFSNDRWLHVKNAYRQWWSGELDRPLLSVTLWGREPGRTTPALPSLGFTSHYGLDVPADQIADRWLYNLECREFLGDAFPHAWPNFGPGVAAAFMGATLQNGPDTTWFLPQREMDIADLHLAYDPDNPWLRRVMDISRVAAQRSGGLVQVAMTDLGGALDILSSFRPSARLLLDLYDHPNEVKRLTWDIHDLWFRYFKDIAAATHPFNPGYSAWTSLFSDEPYYMLQCDFAYMLGPAMFDEFVKPELEAACSRLANPFYHLDGVGQLAHLDSLLRIKELKGIQWVPGDGQKPVDEWLDVFAKIRAAGKLIHVIGWSWEDDIPRLERIMAALGGGKGIFWSGGAPVARKDDVLRFLGNHGAQE